MFDNAIPSKYFHFYLCVEKISLFNTIGRISAGATLILIIKIKTEQNLKT